MHVYQNIIGGFDKIKQYVTHYTDILLVKIICKYSTYGMYQWYKWINNKKEYKDILTAKSIKLIV